MLFRFFIFLLVYKNIVVGLTIARVVVIGQEVTFVVQTMTEQINKVKIVGLKKFLDTFDMSDLVFEDIDENYPNGNCSSESC